MSNKSDKRAKTLLEFMGFKDTDIHTQTHDDYVVEIAKEEVFRKLVSKVIPNESLEPTIPCLHIFRNDKHWNSFNPKAIKKSECIDFKCGCSYRYDGNSVFVREIECHKVTDSNKPNKILEKICKTIQPFGKIDEILESFDYETGDYKKGCKIELEHNAPKIIKTEIKIDDIMIEKHISNKYKQYGFLDDSAKVIVIRTGYIQTKYKKFDIDEKNTNYFVFVEVKTGKTTMGAVTREIEYYKSALGDVYGYGKKTYSDADNWSVIPIVVSNLDIPDHINQFKHIPLSEIHIPQKHNETLSC